MFQRLGRKHAIYLNGRFFVHFLANLNDQDEMIANTFDHCPR